MMNVHELGMHRAAAALATPFILYWVGALGGRPAIRPITCGRVWKLACLVTTLALLFSCGALIQAAFNWATLTHQPEIATLARIGPLQLSFRFDLVESLMLLLVSFLGWVIVHYSRAYMAGDAREPFYISRLLQTLGGCKPACGDK